MNVGLVVNDVETEKAHYTTTLLARAAAARGHHIWHIPVEGFTCRGNRVRVRGWPSNGPEADAATFLARLRGAEPCWFDAADLDVLWLRSNPSEDAAKRPWAGRTVLGFAQLAARCTLVLNDPFGLARAFDKLYMHRFPDDMRPETLVSRDPGSLLAFIQSQRHGSIVKPLLGASGQGVFLVRPSDANARQILDSIRRDGFVIAQPYLPAAQQGDVRLLLVDGELLRVDEKAACVRRVNADGDIRNNLSAGASAERAEPSEAMLTIAQRIGPILREDGMFFAGLDVIGDSLLEINVFSPGGLLPATELYGVDFAARVLETLERRARQARLHLDHAAHP